MANQRIGQPFRHANALQEAEDRFATIETELAQLHEEGKEAGPNAPPAHELNLATGQGSVRVSILDRSWAATSNAPGKLHSG